MKNFLSAFLGSLAAIWVSFFLVVIGGIFMLVSLIASVGGETETKKHTILHISLKGNIDDRYTPITVDDIMGGVTESGQSFEDIINALAYAAKDKNIDGVFFECDGSGLGYALREELQEAVANFKKDSGKWVYAYADAYSQGDYYVVSGADRIFLNPVGTVDIRGVAVQMPFFKGAMDKLGVEMQVVKVGTFKSAVEPFLLEEPSEASLLQTHVFIDAIWGNITQRIAENRGVTSAVVNQWADSLISLQPAEVLKDNKLVTELKYRREVEDILREKTQVKEDDDLRFVSPGEYMSYREAGDDILAAFDAEGDHIAVLYAVGDIADEGSRGIIGNKMVPEILDLAEDEDVKGLVLRVNSGGGSAFASEQIWEALEKFKESGKPFYVSMGDYAASGGYYISCGADKIYADPNTITGSIGIFGMIPCAKGLVKDHLGVNFVTVQTNPSGDMGSIFQPLTEQQRAALQRHVENGYDLFTSRVAAGRSLPVDSVRSIAEGRVWDGRSALRIGLVDELGSLSQVIADMGKHLKMKQVKFMSYPNTVMTPLEEILNSASLAEARTSASAVDGLTPAETSAAIRFVRNIRNSGRVQARMPYLEIR